MTEIFWALLAWITISFIFGSSNTDPPSTSTKRIETKGSQLNDLQENEDDYGYKDDNRASLTASAISNKTVHPLAPADDDSDSMPYPRDRYIKSEYDEDMIKVEHDSDETSSDGAQPSNIKLDRDGYLDDSGVGSSVGESTGRDDRGSLLKKRRSSRG